MALAPVGEEEPDFCEIECWHGYFKCDFVARAVGTDIEVARSRLFRWRRPEPPPAEGEPLAAHEELVERLRELGWEPQGTPRPWYAQRFRLAGGSGPGPAAVRPGAEAQTAPEEPEERSAP
jgi:hypothetical protein